ncbi:hypothetical protein ABGB17_10675 [Sphaerisporangium sp. B11E5]|uniref:hypothetical protein n=1 Tax=Sphaerisporangium sp. B11E5 TaxID=3153563 RepID=UPI00325DCFB0
MAVLDVRRRPGRLTFTRRPPAGRHRRGRPTIPPERPGPDGRRRVWDAAQKARAEQLGLLEPGWLVTYGPYSRRFHAIARTAEVSEPIVEAATPEELRGLMRQSELTGLVPAPRRPDTARRPGAAGCVSRPGWWP